MAEKPYEVSWDARNPQNLNYSRPTGFRFDVLNLPQTSFFCQSVILPGLSLGVATQPTPLSDIPWPGEKLTFSDLTIKFIIQSNFENYTELYNWFIGLGAPTSNSEFVKWIETHNWNFPIEDLVNRHTGAQMFSDAVLSVLSANNVPSVQFHFHSLFPIGIQAVEFDISKGNTQFLTAYATFKYHYFVPVPLNTET